MLINRCGKVKRRLSSAITLFLFLHVPPRQVANHPEPGVCPEKESLRGAGPQLLDPETAIQERAPADPTSAYKPAIT